MISYTLPETRLLLSSLLDHYLPKPGTSWLAGTGVGDASTKPGPAAANFAAQLVRYQLASA